MPALFRLFVISFFVLLVTQPTRRARACPVVAADDEAIVSVSLSNIGKADVLLQWYEGASGGWCHAGLELPVQRLASLRFIPRFEDIADPVGSVARKIWSADRCSVMISVTPQRYGIHDWNEYHCVFGAIFLDQGAWIASEEDSDC